MGATNFYTEASGTSLESAFSKAVKEARYWHGHGGYSGTIAEKPCAVEFNIPLTALPEATEDTRFSFGERVANALSECAYQIYDDNGAIEQWLAQESKYDFEKQTKIDIKALIAAMGKPAFFRMANAWNEKWEAAVGFRIGKNKYAFCGLASC